MSTLLIVAMFLFFTVLPIVYRLYFLALAFTVYGMVFGFEEFMADYYTGKTVSQHIWALIVSNSKKGYKLLAFMLAGWLCFVAHFLVTGLLSTIFFSLFFLFIAIPSILDKEYFLTLSSALFVLSIGFTDSLSRQYLGVSIWSQIHNFILIHPIKGSAILVSLVMGWGCLLTHLGMRFKK